MEPLTIAALAFIGTKAAETTVEKVTEAAIEKAKLLREKIINKLRGNPRAEVALQRAEPGSKTELKVVSDYLQEAMRADSQFAQEIEVLAREIDNLNQGQGENWQVSGGEVNYNKVSGDLTYDNKKQSPVIEGTGSNTTISITYNNPPQH
ncbi:MULTISPECIES: hypothetical protein [unclassified Moorena]|uniref:hypothetical protein n=1 Tax=unclassified Moorena TaxID=2683338 RepID=UPI0014015625|nr:MULTISPECIES: hypothetical protein [unclassified Moorena]NEO11290.1 hypothetical protein [Moorena sp. SIO3E8]NEP98796.1 hypothetical protein [Moorena sp. SIO3F7]